MKHSIWENICWRKTNNKGAPFAISQGFVYNVILKRYISVRNCSFTTTFLCIPSHRDMGDLYSSELPVCYSSALPSIYINSLGWLQVISFCPACFLSYECSTLQTPLPHYTNRKFQLVLILSLFSFSFFLKLPCVLSVLLSIKTTSM